MTHKCNNQHLCVLGNLFSHEYDKSFFDYDGDSVQKAPTSKVTVYIAKKIITLNSLQKEATAIAIQDQYIYSIGSLENVEKTLQAKNISYDVDKIFENNYFYPGFIESHCHVSLEALYTNFEYVGAFNRFIKANHKSIGLKDNNAVISKLKEIAKNNDAFVFAWGYDPSVLPDNKVLDVEILDTISQTKPVVVLNMSGHIAYVNSKTLELAGYSNETNIEGVIRKNNKLTGELQELEALAPLLKKLKLDNDKILNGINDFAKRAQQKGITTVTDLGLGLVPNVAANMLKATQNTNFPVKINNYIIDHVFHELGGIDFYKKLKEKENDRLKLSGVKIVTDGSIQGYTANVKWPYYFDKDTKGIKNIELAPLITLLTELVANNINVAIHTNGDAAIERALNAIETVSNRNTNKETRVRLEHCQMVTNSQLDKIQRHHVLVNFFINHLYYWGDFHKNHTLGPERVKFMNPLASAKNRDITFSLHSDAPITAIDPLLMIQNAVLRQSLSTNETLGKDECLSAYDALLAITKNAAFLLGEEKTKGSLEIGKLADITILEQDILECEANKIADTNIIGTIMNGKAFIN